MSLLYANLGLYCMLIWASMLILFFRLLFFKKHFNIVTLFLPINVNNPNKRYYRNFIGNLTWINYNFPPVPPNTFISMYLLLWYVSPSIPKINLRGREHFLFNSSYPILYWQNLLHILHIMAPHYPGKFILHHILNVSATVGPVSLFHQPPLSSTNSHLQIFPWAARLPSTPLHL